MLTVTALPVGELEANCYIAQDGAGHALVIDPGAEAPRILAFLSEHHLTTEAILLTHVHYDHITAAHAVREACRVPLWCGAEDEPALRDDQRNLTALFAPGWVLPEITADFLCRDGDAICTEHFSLIACHTPGHTPGSYCYRTRGQVFTGDTLFAGTVGRTDFPGGSMTALRQSLQKLSALPPETVLYPGHYESTTVASENRNNPYMLGLSDYAIGNL